MRGSLSPKGLPGDSLLRNRVAALSTKPFSQRVFTWCAVIGDAWSQSMPKCTKSSISKLYTSISSQNPFSLFSGALGIKLLPKSTPSTCSPRVIALVPLRCIPRTTTKSSQGALGDSADKFLVFLFMIKKLIHILG